MKGEKVKQLREDKGISQSELADFCAVTPSAISQFESNKKTPSTKVLMKIADALKVSVKVFLEGDENIKVQDLAKDKEVITMFRDFKDLSKDDKDIIKDHIEFLKQKRVKKEDVD